MSEKKKKTWLAPMLLGGLIILVVVVTAFLTLNHFGFKISSPSPEPVASSTYNATQEAASLISKVAQLMVLPDEEPYLATVQDSTKLHDQTFFALAQDGDKVLIFSAAKKAVIYRESENRIINVGSVVINDNNLSTPVLSNSNTSSGSATN